MADLIEKFFRSELTEAEDQALAKLLASSEDAAERFAQKAEKVYFGFGLPEPKAPGKLARFLKSSWGRWAPVVVLSGVGVWHYWPQVESQPLPVVVSSPVMAPVPAQTELKIIAPVSRKAEKPIGPPPVPTESVVLTPSIPNGATPVPAGMDQAPPNPGFDTDYRNLRVVVDQEAAGSILVRITGPDGTEVRRLYEGPLAVGKWAFTWDGLLDQNRAATSGIYHIEVKGNGNSMSKEVMIR